MSKMNPMDLPLNWQIVRFQEVVKFTKKPKDLRYSEYSEVPFVPMNLIPIATLFSDKFTLRPTNALSSGTYFEPGDILLAKITPSFENGKQSIIEDLPTPFGIATTEVIPIREVEGVSDRVYLFYYLLSPDVRALLTARMKGTTGRLRLGAETLADLEFPLPPLAEQRRIVAKLEVLFAQLDAAVDNLKKAQVQLQRYRQSLLKAAFEGELTSKEKEVHLDSWESIKLSEFITLESGSRPKGGVRNILEGVPSLGGEHLNSDGGFNFEKIRYVPEKYFESLNKGQINLNDIIIVKDGATTGKTSFVDNYFPYNEAAVNEHLFIVRIDPKVAFPKFMFYYLYSSKGQEQILSDFRGATVGGISRNFPLKVTVPIPSLTEQEQIVFELERHLSVADEIEATLDAELKRAERLRQSILKQAFSGKLVPQDPNDEPASILLEKIRDEKEYQQPKRKKTTTKRKTPTSTDQLSLPLD
ncbi:hypothetical protein F4X73_01270 [Candidatus Poribacteria bacterium]|nr:hypothetical protein [Candidatus Poribacteria bacterium]